MCMLTYYAPGAQPDTNALHNGAFLNDDGHGFAIVTARGLLIRHSMRGEELITRFDSMRRKYPDGPALFHSRMGTAGTRDRRNCHPFRLRGDRRTIIAHNGILPRDAQPLGKDRRCDTRIAAESIFPYQFGPLHTADALKRAEMWIGRYNKVVILTTNPVYDQSAYILNEKAGHWLGDTWYSNHDHENWYQTTAPTVIDAKLDTKCVYCGSEESVTPEQSCAVCELCQDCGEDWATRCQCRYPSRTWSVSDEYAGWWAAQIREEMNG